MKYNYIKMGAFAALLTLGLSACRKDRMVVNTPEISGTKGIYVLAEGGFNANNSAISYYDIASNTSEVDFYKKVNGSSIGQNVNDLKAYGSKMYCVITGTGSANTGFVDIMNIATGKSLVRIPYNSSQPRFVTFANGKAYISAYDGKITRIDTASMTIDATLQLKNGTNNASALEGLATSNGKLYVTNSAGFGAVNSLRTKLTVIDLTSFIKKTDIEVGVNPVRAVAAPNGDVYVTTWVDYASANLNTPTLVRINTITDAVVQTENYDLATIAIGKNGAWTAKDIYSNPSIKSINIATGKIGNDLITDGTVVPGVYGLTINDFDNSIVVTDNNGYSGTNGKAFVYTAEGKRKYTFNTAGFPQAAVFNYTYK